jgi:hypothetical protein
MAARRMFSNRFTNSAKFLKMPLEAQALYFHLALNADDDGVCEGFTIMRLIGSSEDSLKLLNLKGYIQILNEDLVVFIVDWLEHNKIRPDRKIDSVYKHLLIESNPEVKLIETRERKDRIKEVVHGTSHGQKKDSIGKVRLGKDRLVKENISAFFDRVWSNYPNKKGKGGIKPATIEKLYKEYTEEELLRCIERYKKEIETKGIEERFIKYGSTFFNGGFLDYTDENYQEAKVINSRFANMRL